MWSSAKSKLPAPGEALPGRAEKMPVPARHFVNGAPLDGPWPAGMQLATFGMGCFWGAERKFWEKEGVFSTAVGYAGGTTPNPTYREVCSGLTGQNEVVQVVFDPKAVSYDELLKLFWENHDPTQGYRQGNDAGTQYRSAIFYADEKQKEQAAAFIKELDDAKTFKNPIVTTLEPLGDFYAAEDYHQKFYANNPYQPYCQYMIPPKLTKLHKQFKELLKSHGG